MMKFRDIKDVKKDLKAKKYSIEKEDWFKRYVEFIKENKKK